jgi:hypothetical protein
MMSREAAVKLSRALSAMPQEEPIQIQPASSSPAKHAAAEKSEHAKTPAKAHAKVHAAPKAAKKHAAEKKEKPKAKAKPKSKKDK